MVLGGIRRRRRVTAIKNYASTDKEASIRVDDPAQVFAVTPSGSSLALTLFFFFRPLIVRRFSSLVRVIPIHALEGLQRVREIFLVNDSVWANHECFYSGDAILGRHRRQGESANHGSLHDEVGKAAAFTFTMDSGRIAHAPALRTSCLGTDGDTSATAKGSQRDMPRRKILPTFRIA